ncbi:multidrug efflux pump subunit AcrA (membrane-fusion protein) [Chitinophaga dinghuensis]|uniref:Multidrug efflux pump subunit AcrA (Membrane-fusion protein) n=1 Tax=Chitinophaga dinghuensis TaxID=1539050 RepID=A0A327VQ96_9BACT|nr:HlyD family efflux transporter periplasmic adaptor subunit [Chitinophaga dinghuensis]RAJ76604.1 multidrug efflux pump subunit AcrA (membrane-fusion protein) [Chitinophaga dinghuensis]
MQNNFEHIASQQPDYYDDVNEDIIGRPPRKILLWANLIIGAIFLCFFVASIFIKSPYKINSPVDIFYSKQPVNIDGASSSSDISLLVKDNATIRKGMPIANLDRDISYTSLLQLKSSLMSGDFSQVIPDSLGKFGTAYTRLRSMHPAHLQAAEKDSLLASISAWEKHYLICSPVAGRIAFNTVYDNPSSNSGHLGRILPENGTFTAYSWITQHDLTKIKVGQKVQIKLDQFPVEEYGYILGSVEAKLNGKKDNLYLIRISLLNGLVTDKGLKIDTTYQLQGHGEIIVYEKSLLNTFIGKNRIF